MSSPASRRSIDNAKSPRPSSSSSSYPFPQDSFLQGSGSNSRYSGRHGSRSGSITSLGGILDSSAQIGGNTIAEADNNAISTLLQTPIVRTGLLPHTAVPGAQKFPSARDIPPVTLSNIPNVDSSVFKPYLAQAGSLYEAFRRAKESNDLAGSYRGRRSRATSKTDGGKSPVASTSQPVGPSSPLVGSPLEPPLHTRRASGGGSRRGLLPVTPLSTIPSVYFEEGFHLENPRTFDIVSERSEIVRQNGDTNEAGVGRKALSTNAILQEKLSWFMDTVELHLISSISTASTSLFTALGSLKELHTEASESVAKVKSLRDDLETLDKEMAIGGLKVVALRRRRENVRKLGAAVQQLQDVIQAVSQCEEQVDRGDVDLALETLDDAERLIAGDTAESSRPDDGEFRLLGKPLIDLRGVAALEGSTNDLANLRRRIGKGFESRFMEALLGDLRSHVDQTAALITLQRWDKAAQRARGSHSRAPSVYPSYLHLDDSLRQALRANLEGLNRSECVMPATTAYREGVLKEVKNLIRRHLPSSSDDDAESTMSASTHGGRPTTQQERSSILARNLRALDSDDAEQMLKKIYSNVGEALRRLGTQVKVLLDLTSGIKKPPSTSKITSPLSPPIANMDSYMNGSATNQRSISRARAPSEDIQQALDMSSILGQAVDIAQTQITKILKVRAEQTSHLSLADFLRYFYLNRLFADECEAVSGRGGAALKTIVNNHIKDFVAQFSNNQRQILVQGMDTDRWDANDFTELDSGALLNVLEASTKDVDSWTKLAQLWPDEHKITNGDSQDAEENPSAVQAANDKIRRATIDEQKYILPGSAITVLRGISAFEQLITGIPSMAQEVTASLLEYLKLFNSRSSQLILGAGATRSAGLKNITTKHLALASQALSFVIALIPHVREFVRRHAHASGNLMVEFDKVKRLYQEHQSGINDKLVDIMGGRAGTHIGAMKKVGWDSNPSAQAVNSYMETLVKETTTLHKVLGKHLPEMTVQMIMEPVFSSYREQLGKAFADVEIKTSSGKQRMMRDVEFFRSRISKLEGSGSLGDFLVQLVDNKPVGEEGKPSTDASEQPNGKADQKASQDGVDEKT
ncbi:MAG: hypothetical protein Q9191_004074 [Dirinaria sp. TL-2023a]